MYVEHIRIFGLQLIDEVNRSCICVLSLCEHIYWYLFGETNPFSE